MKDPSALFICYDTGDSYNPHPTGEVRKWIGKVPLRREQRQNANGQNVLMLKTHKDYEIRYTTDGSNPKESGGAYSGEIVLPANCRFVLTATYYKGKLVDEETIPISVVPGKKKLEIDDAKLVEYTLSKRKKCGDTVASYSEFALLKQLPGTFIRDFTVTIVERDNNENYLEITTSSRQTWTAEGLQTTVDAIRESAFAGKAVDVEFEYKTILFTTGAAFKQWVDQNKLDWSELTKKGEIRQ